MGSVVFPLCGKYSNKTTSSGSYHADVALLPFVITPTGEELLLYSANRMGLLDVVFLEEYLSRTALFKFANDFNLNIDESSISNHPAYYCSYNFLKLFAKEGPIRFSMYFELDMDAPWIAVKHWLGFEDVFILFQGRLLDFYKSLELVRNNQMAYNSLNNGGPTPDRVIKASVFHENVPKIRKFRAVRAKNI